MKITAYISIITLLLICGCSRFADLQNEEGQMVIVPISAGISAYENDAATKGLAPYIPDVENLIHDVWVVQYSSRGVLLPRSTFHYRTTGNGVLEWNGMTYEESTGQGIALIESDEPCTVCFIANMGENVPQWPDNIYTFREIMMPVLDSDPSVALTKIPLCGYYHGPVKHGNAVNVSLGRMITRLNIVVNNLTGKDITDLSVAITNAPRYAHIYPNTEITQFNGNENTTREQRDAGMSLEAGSSKNLYYYMAPNLYANAWPTTLWTKCNVGGVAMEGGLILGDTPPTESEVSIYPPEADPSRDLRLYPNNQYTFTINFVDQK